MAEQDPTRNPSAAALVNLAKLLHAVADSLVELAGVLPPRSAEHVCNELRRPAGDLGTALDAAIDAARALEADN